MTSSTCSSSSSSSSASGDHERRPNEQSSGKEPARLVCPASSPSAGATTVSAAPWRGAVPPSLCSTSSASPAKTARCEGGTVASGDGAQGASSPVVTKPAVAEEREPRVVETLLRGHRVFLVRTRTLDMVLPAAPRAQHTPEQFLERLLRSRGYDARRVASLETEFRTVPTEKQIADYDLTFVTAVRSGDLETIRKLHAEGRSMNACNKVHGTPLSALVPRMSPWTASRGLGGLRQKV